MEFRTIQEAFNHYRTQTLEQIEARAAAIKTEVSTNAGANIDTLNIELEGLSQAKANLAEKRSEQLGQQAQGGAGWNPVTGMNLTGAQHSVARADGDVAASVEYRSAFYNSMVGRELTTEQRAVMERVRTERRDAFISTSEAAAVIPTTMLNEIVRHATEHGGVLSLVRRLSMPSGMAIPVALPSEMAQWKVEGAEVTPSTVKPTNVKFAGYELMKLFSLSAAARAMSLPAFESYLTQELSRCMVAALEHSVLHGTGTGQPVGLLDAITITESVSATGQIWEALTNTVGAMKRGYSRGAVWAMNTATLYKRIAKALTGDGKPLFQEPTNQPTGRILGRSIVEDDFIPDDVILFGNFQYYALNMPENIMLEVSRDSAFRSGLIDYRALAVADGKPIITDAFVKLEFESA